MYVDGGAGVVSTAEDMARWLSVQANQGNNGDTTLISAASLRTMRSRPADVKSGYGMGWFVRSDSSLYHNGILWTYSSEAMVDIQNGYGVVLLFNGGVNPFVDTYSFLQGITDIIDGKEPESSSVPDVVYPIITAVVFLILFGLLIHSMLTVKKWKIKYHQRAKWKSWFYMTLRLIPACLLIFVPLIITAMSGRVLSWHRIFLMAPDIIGGLLIGSILNLIVIGSRLFSVFGDKK